MTTNQSISVAQLVKPKFEAGAMVWIVLRDGRGFIARLTPARVHHVLYMVTIANNGEGEQRNEKLTYRTSDGDCSEGELIASLDELDAADRKPRENNRY